MTKAELIEAMKDFPDDMEVVLCVNSCTVSVQSIYSEEYKFWVSMPLPLDDEYKSGVRIILEGYS